VNISLQSLWRPLFTFNRLVELQVRRQQWSVDPVQLSTGRDTLYQLLLPTIFILLFGQEERYGELEGDDRAINDLRV